MAKSDKSKISEAEQVEAYMDKIKHPMKPELEVMRKIIKDASTKISERIKWNAPSYYYKEDIVTFNVRPTEHVHLVFHHPTIVEVKSSMLQGDYKDRRMAYFKDMKEIKANKNELQKIINEVINKIETT